jgi:hypothetical protein
VTHSLGFGWDNKPSQQTDSHAIKCSILLKAKFGDNFKENDL